MDWALLFEVTLAGIGSGGLYALAGVAFVLIYKATMVVNLAIGEMMMLGAYFMFAATSGTGWPIWLGILIAIAGSGLLGAIIERAAIRPLIGQSRVAAFMVTLGLSSILAGTAQLFWGADEETLPAFFPAAPITVGPAMVQSKVFYGFLIVMALIAVALALFRFSRGGVALRATASDQGAAYSMGINVPRVFSLAWIVGAMIAAVAGIVVASISGLSPVLATFGLSVMVVALVGGMDSMAGALVAGFVVGLVESWTISYVGTQYRTVATFTLLIVIMIIRPYGLFGTREIERL